MTSPASAGESVPSCLKKIDLKNVLIIIIINPQNMKLKMCSARDTDKLFTQTQNILSTCLDFLENINVWGSMKQNVKNKFLCINLPTKSKT